MTYIIEFGVVGTTGYRPLIPSATKRMLSWLTFELVEAGLKVFAIGSIGSI